MKIIDLMNKMANKETLPKRIGFDKDIYYLNPEGNNYIDEEDGGYTLLGAVDGFINMGDKLNDEIEIIEENQDIDIQSIEEFNKEDLALYNLSTGEHLLSGDLKDKLNEVLGAIKQLDRQINNN